MKLANVEDFNWLYAILRIFPGFVHNHIFYKKVYTSGLENIPDEGPVIFAPNHQNALMDALIITSIKNWQPVFMARADIFAGQFVRQLLFFMKILPIFRIRDGKESLKQNDAIFQKAVKVLKKKRFLVIYPEASHQGKRHLRPLKKGITRIAFMAEEATNYTLGVKIVPVGINYQNYFNFRSNALINFGKPIVVNDFRELYKENPQKANHELIKCIADGIRPLIIDINNSDYYDNFETARMIFAPYIIRKERKIVNNFKNTVYAGQKFVKMLDEISCSDTQTFNQLNSQLAEYRELLKLENLRDWVIRRDVGFLSVFARTMLLLSTSPIALFGFINNFIPYWLPWLITRKIKDKNFHTSIRFGVYMIAFPLVFYPLIFVLLAKFTEPWWVKYVYMALLPITGIFAHRYYIIALKLKATWKYVLNKSKKNFVRLRELRSEILETLVKKYRKNKNSK